MTPNGAPLAFLLDHVNAPHSDNDPCVLWPYGKAKGYGKLRIAGKWRTAHRVLLELRDGPAPEHRPCALHGRCHEPLCIIHTRWGSHAENVGDKVRAGTARRGERHNMAKLTTAQVATIRHRLAAGESQSTIAKAYPVDRRTIGRIANYRLWVS